MKFKEFYVYEAQRLNIYKKKAKTDECFDIVE